jgi:hypothetical protein
MAISKAEKAAYNDYIKEYKYEVDEYIKKIKENDAKKKKMPNIEGYLNLENVTENLNIIMTYIKMSDASIEMLNVKNERFLDNARKEIYKAIQTMESIVGSQIDRSLKENEEYLERIDRVNPRQILRIIQRINYVFSKIVEKMGEGSKWKWSFVDLHGRLAVITKNIINFSDVQRYRDPRSDYYRERQELLALCKKSLGDVAKQYRNRYELSTRVPGDIIKSIDMLSALRKIHILFGESEEATKLKNTIDALRATLEADEKKKEMQKKKKDDNK